MCKYILSLLGSVLGSVLFLSPFAMAGGEIGNETIAPDGRPRSIAVQPCLSRYTWGQFSEETRKSNPDLDGFLTMIREVYPPFYARLVREANSATICVTDTPIDVTLPNLPEAPPRIALWVSRAEGSKNLLLINRPLFYSGKVTSAERAATVVRELLHPVFHWAHPDSKSIDSIEWMKHNLVYAFHRVYTSQDQEAGRGDLRQMLEDFGLVELSSDFTVACGLLSLSECQQAYEAYERFPALDPVIPQIRITLATLLLYDSPPLETIDWLVSESSRYPDTIGFSSDTWIWHPLYRVVERLESLEDIVILERITRRKNGGMSPDHMDDFKRVVLRKASQHYQAGEKEMAKKFVDYVRSLKGRVPTQTYPADPDSLKEIEFLLFAGFSSAEAARIFDLGQRPEAPASMIPINEFKAVADRYPEVAKAMAPALVEAYGRYADSRSLYVDCLAYLVARGIVTENIKSEKTHLKKILRDNNRDGLARKL